MHKIVASVSLMMCLSAGAYASDYRYNPDGDVQANLFQFVGWETNNMQASAFSKLRKQIEKLESENEQLRNSISRMVAGQNRSAQVLKNDPRIQALVEENKRLIKLLNKTERSNSKIASSSDGVYAGKIASLRSENKELKEQVRKLSNNSPKVDYSLIDSYKEENALLKEALNQRDNGSDRIVVLQKQIQDLKNKNEGLELKIVQRNNYRADKRIIKEKDVVISSLQEKIQNLQRKNQELISSIDDESQRSKGASLHADKVNHAYKNNLKALESLNERLDKMKLENAKLRKELSSNNDRNMGKNDQVAVLKKQNESLRATIKAQNEDLVLADNAAKTAERLLTENQILKRNVDLVSKSNTANNETTQELIERNKKLLNGIAQRDKYIKKLDGLKETVKLLRIENDKLLLSQSNNNHENIEVSDLLKRNNELQDDLNKERESVIAYRTKIKEYQDKISEISNGAKNISLENKIRDMNAKITSLSLENQELKARINILSKDKQSSVFHKADVYFDSRPNNSSDLLEVQTLNSNVGFVRGKKEIISKHDSSDNGIEEVTYIDTKYPPVDEVAPVLKQDGSHTDMFTAMEDDKSSAEDMSKTSTNVSSANIKPEDLLAQELNPLD